MTWWILFMIYTGTSFRKEPICCNETYMAFAEQKKKQSKGWGLLEARAYIIFGP